MNNFLSSIEDEFLIVVATAQSEDVYWAYSICFFCAKKRELLILTTKLIKRIESHATFTNTLILLSSFCYLIFPLFALFILIIYIGLSVNQILLFSILSLSLYIVLLFKLKIINKKDTILLDYLPKNMGFEKIKKIVLKLMGE